MCTQIDDSANKSLRTLSPLVAAQGEANVGTGWQMETPNQIGHGLAALVIAVVVTSLLANVFLPVMPAGAQRFTGALGVGTFVVVWWAAYLIVVHIVRKRTVRNQSEER